MTRRTFRSLSVELLAIAGTVLLLLAAAMTSAFAFGEGTALIMGSAGNPESDPGYVTTIDNLYVASDQLHTWGPEFPGGAGYSRTGYAAPEGMYPPEQVGPETGIHDLTFDMALAQGRTDLSTAISAQLADGNNVVVFGYSQSASIVASYFDLAADEQPSPGQLAFMLVGDIDRPGNGVLERLDGLYIPLLDMKFAGAIPSDVYQTIDTALRYSGSADSPQHSLDVPANLDAIAGIYYLHPTYPDLTPEQIASGVVEPVASADTNTTYILTPTESLPLLDPLRGSVPAPLLDPVQPPLKVLVELGYDRTAPQDVPTPAGLFPKIDLITVITDLDRATTEGVNNALVDVGLPPLPDAAPTDTPLTDIPPVDTQATTPSILAAAEVPDVSPISLPPLSADFDELVGGAALSSPDFPDIFLVEDDVFGLEAGSQWDSIPSDVSGSLPWPQVADLGLDPAWPIDPNQPVDPDRLLSALDFPE